MNIRCTLPLFLLFIAFTYAACEGKAVTDTSVTYALTAKGGDFLGPTGSRLFVPVQTGFSMEGVTLTLSQVDPDLIPERAGHRRLAVGFWVESNVQGLVFNPPARVELRYARGELSTEVQRHELLPSRCAAPYGASQRPSERPPVSWSTLPDGIADPAIGSYQANTTEIGLFSLFAPESVFGVDGDQDTADGDHEAAEAEPDSSAEGDSGPLAEAERE